MRVQPWQGSVSRNSSSVGCHIIHGLRQGRALAGQGISRGLLGADWLCNWVIFHTPGYWGQIVCWASHGMQKRGMLLTPSHQRPLFVEGTTLLQRMLLHAGVSNML